MNDFLDKSKEAESNVFNEASHPALIRQAVTIW